MSVQLVYVNSTYITIKENFENISDELSIIISDLCSFYANNYFFQPDFKEGNWDGKIRLWHMGTELVYIGLYEYIKEYLEEIGHTVQVDPRILDAIETPDDEYNERVSFLSSFIETVGTYSQGEQIYPREDQLEAVYRTFKLKRCINVCPTSFGKSLCMYLQTIEALRHERRVLIIVPSITLVDQMASDFIDYSNNDLAYQISDKIHKIYSGQDKNTDRSIVVSTWQSVWELPKKWYNNFDVVIIDEAHKAKAKCMKTLLEKSENIAYRYGWTGTIKGVGLDKLALQGLIGSIKQITTTKKLMDAKIVALLKIDTLYLQYDIESCKYINKCTYAEEVDYIEKDSDRMSFLSKLLVSTPKTTMCMFRHKKHGENIFKAIRAIVGDSRNVYLIHGTTIRCNNIKYKKVEEIKAQLEQEENAIIVASYGVFSTGVSIKNIHYICFGSPIKSYTSVLQSIGRGLRISNVKHRVVLFDVVDCFRFKRGSRLSKMNYALDHYTQRLMIYSEEKFDVSARKISIGKGVHE